MAVETISGLNRVQAPGQTVPKIFKTLSMKIENLSIAEYRAMIMDRCGDGGFKQGVIRDLEARRHCGC